MYKEETVQPVKVNPPRVLITPAAKQRLDFFLALCPDEISGLGQVKKIGNNFLIEEIFLLEQKVSAGSTDLNPEDVSKFMLEMIQSGKDTGAIKLWWHSHVNSGCFWSHTDEATANRFANGWMISIVGNKHGEYKVRLDLYDPIRFTLDDIRFEVRQADDPKMRDRCQKEIDAKVQKRYFAPVGSRRGLRTYGAFDDQFVVGDEQGEEKSIGFLKRKNKTGGK